VKALTFAQSKHKGQLQKEVTNAPIINHLIEVLHWINIHVSEIDESLYCAALLHDILEKTNTTENDLNNLFNPAITSIVRELTDNPHSSKTEQKAAQITGAKDLSRNAGIIRIADKVQNIQFISNTPELGWSTEQKFEYFEWAEQVVYNIEGLDELKSLFKDEHRWARLKL
jgi:guanosine-3',5'-bis(diphosphate) 3'-pyrophosphohydrolase